MFMDINEEIRFRVVDETFVDLTPTGPEVLKKDQLSVEEQEIKKSPYSITVRTLAPTLRFGKNIEAQCFLDFKVLL